MRGLSTFVITAALLPALVSSSPVGDWRVSSRDSELGVAANTHVARTGILGSVFGLLTGHSNSNDNSGASVKVSSSLNADVRTDFISTAKLLGTLNQDCASPPSGVSVNAFLGASSNLLSCTSADAVAKAVVSLKAETDALLGGSVSGDFKTHLSGLSKLLGSLHGSLKGNNLTGVNTSIGVAGNNFGDVCTALGVSVKITSLGSVSVDVSADLKSAASILVSLANGSIKVPSGVSLQPLLSSSNRLVTCKSANAVVDVLPSVEDEVNVLLKGSLSGDILTQLQGLQKIVVGLKGSLTGQAVPTLDTKLKSCGGVVTGLLSNLGLNFDATIFTKVSTGASVSIDVSADLKSAVSILVSLADGSISIPSGISVEGLFDSSNKLVGCNSASAVVDVLPSVESHVNVLLNGSLSGDILAKLQALQKIVVGLKGSLTGQAVPTLDTKMKSCGGSVSGLVGSLGLNVNASIFAQGSAAVGLNADVAANLKSVVELLGTVTSGSIEVPSTVSLNNLVGLKSQLSSCNSADTLSSLLVKVDAEVKGLVGSLKGCGCELHTKLQSLSGCVGGLKGSLVGNAPYTVNKALSFVGGTLGRLSLRLGVSL